MKGFLIPLSAVLALLASIVRLLLVSNYQTTTAVAVASGAGPLSTLIGSLIPVVQVFLPILTLVLFILTLFNLKNGHGGKILIVAVCSLVATFLITPTELSLSDSIPRANETWNTISPYISIGINILVWLIFGIILVLAAIFLARIGWKRRRGWHFQTWDDWDDWGLARIGGIVMPVLGVMGALGLALLGGVVSLALAWVTFFPLESEVARVPDRARSMWLPAEEVALKSGGNPTVGYVLSVGNGWMTLLKEPDRTVNMLPLSEVVSRKICRFGPSTPFPLIALPGASIPNIAECRK